MLDVQGAVSEHVESVRAVGCEPVPVKRPEDLDKAEALIIPGGESTTIGRLIRRYGLFGPIRERAETGMPVFGTCAGMILLAKRIEGEEEPHLGLMDVTVNRNSFGRQRESFEADVEVKEWRGAPFPGVFIRAPHISFAGPGVDVLAIYEGRIVAARQGRLLATSFHPELSGDVRLHAWFRDMIE